MWELVADLRDMGESNAILGRRTHISRDVLLAASSIYQGEWPDNSPIAPPFTFSSCRADVRTVRKRGRHSAGDVPDDLLHRVEAGPESAQALGTWVGEDELERRALMQLTHACVAKL